VKCPASAGPISTRSGTAALSQPPAAADRGTLTGQQSTRGGMLNVTLRDWHSQARSTGTALWRPSDRNQDTGDRPDRPLCGAKGDRLHRGMPGRQITLMAIEAALITATVAVLLGRACIVTACRAPWSVRFPSRHTCISSSTIPAVPHEHRSTGEAPSSTPAASPRLLRRPSPWPPRRQSHTCQGVPRRASCRCAPRPAHIRQV
jgi:hypothetical protein